jgi:hypothetical protein
MAFTIEDFVRTLVAVITVNRSVGSEVSLRPLPPELDAKSRPGLANQEIPRYAAPGENLSDARSAAAKSEQHILRSRLPLARRIA